MKKIIIVGVILAAVLVLVIFGIAQTRNQTKPQAPQGDEIVLYYGNTCPHCKEVEDFISKNNIKAKINLVEKEVYQNQGNAKELGEAAQKCGLATDSVGVPFLFAEGKCFIGTPDVVSYLSQKAGISNQTATGSATVSAETGK